MSDIPPMEGIGFDGRERPKDFPTGRWLLAFAIGDFVWWAAWLFICYWTKADDLFGAIFVGANVFGVSLYTPGVRLLAAIIILIPFVLTAAISYRFKFGDRSRWTTLVWIGAAYVLSFVTRFLVLFLSP